MNSGIDSRGNQNVFHESLILTNSLITPTPLSLGNLYRPNNGNGFDFCQQREDLLNYLNFDRIPLKTELGRIPSQKPELEPELEIPKDLWKVIGGQASDRKTEIIMKRCPNQKMPN